MLENLGLSDIGSPTRKCLAKNCKNFSKYWIRNHSWWHLSILVLSPHIQMRNFRLTYFSSNKLLCQVTCPRVDQEVWSNLAFQLIYHMLAEKVWSIWHRKNYSERIWQKFVQNLERFFLVSQLALFIHCCSRCLIFMSELDVLFPKLKFF